MIEFAPVVTWLHRLPRKPPYDKVSYSLCSTDGLIIRKGERVNTGKFYSPNQRYSISFVDSGAKIYDEVGGFYANEGGFFHILGLEIAADGQAYVFESPVSCINLYRDSCFDHKIIKETLEFLGTPMVTSLEVHSTAEFTIMASLKWQP